MSAPGSYGSLEIRPKRGYEEIDDGYDCTRLGPNGRPNPLSLAENRARQTASANNLPQGTEYNPVEIESSPELEPKTNTPRPTIAPEHSARIEQRSAGLVIQQVDSSVRKPKYYAVAGGHAPGVYTNWADVERQIKGYSGAKQQKFSTEAAALSYLDQQRSIVRTALNRRDAHRELPQIIPPAYFDPPLGTSYPHPLPVFLPPQHPQMASHSSPGRNVMNTDYTSTSTHLQALRALNSASLPAPPIDESFAAEPEPTLSAEQQQVVDLILQGHNVFYTGSAGCGKSTILKVFVKKMQAQNKRVKIVAPTNLAALNVNGQTTWSYAGWTPDSMKKPLDKLMQAAHGTEVSERFDSTDVLVLDEVSMVENLMFERLNCIMKASIGEKKGGGAFGGVQVIVTGDFCQLAPVKPFRHCIGCGWELIPDNKYSPKEHRCENRRCNRDVFYDIDKWAFRSEAWQECNFKHINLTEIHRQHDKMFISILQRIRTEGVILPNHARVLLNHTSETEDAIKLFARREDVDRTNNENINKLAAVARTYKCIDHFDWKPHHRDDKSLEKNTRLADDGNGTLHALKEHRYEVFIQLKEGMRVVLQANLEPTAGLVNGSQGSIIGFEPYDPAKLPRKLENRDTAGTLTAVSLRGTHAKYFEQQIKIFATQNQHQPWPIVKFDNGLLKTIYADCTANELGNEEPYSLLSRTQIPLMAGYAITVHKSQGMTLDRVIVDLGRAFEPSQIYVALSRARSLKGLKVVALPQRNLGGANAQVKEFFAEYLSKK